MEIRCKIEREGGSLVTLDGTNYAFKPNAQGDHVCNVPDTNKAHIKRLLSITEGYEVYMPDEAEDEPQAPVQASEPPPAPAPEPQTPAQEPDPISPALNADTDASEPEGEDEKTDDAADAIENLSDADLAAKYEDVFSRKAHPNAKRETLIEKIRAEQAALAEAGLTNQE